MKRKWRRKGGLRSKVWVILQRSCLFAVLEYRRRNPITPYDSAVCQADVVFRKIFSMLIALSERFLRDVLDGSPPTFIYGKCEWRRSLLLRQWIELPRYRRLRLWWQYVARLTGFSNRQFPKRIGHGCHKEKLLRSNSSCDGGKTKLYLRVVQLEVLLFHKTLRLIDWVVVESLVLIHDSITHSSVFQFPWQETAVEAVILWFGVSVESRFRVLTCSAWTDHLSGAWCNGNLGTHLKS